MKVTLDSKRILHLLSLILSSYLIAKLLQIKFDWTPMAAWGVAISTTCQISNAIMSILDPTSDNNNGDENKQWLQERKRELEKRKERRKRAGGGGAASVTAANDIADNGSEKKD